MHHNVMLTADNQTYGTGKDKGITNGIIVEAGMYEVPLSLKRDAEPHYDIDPLEATYAVPNEYEYATWGPNEEMVHNT